MASFVRGILEEAADTIDNRAHERDLAEERSMAASVAAFNAIFGTNLTETQGWQFMQILKITRSRTGPFKPDHYVDGAAYAALAAEARQKEATARHEGISAELANSFAEILSEELRDDADMPSRVNAIGD